MRTINKVSGSQVIVLLAVILFCFTMMIPGCATPTDDTIEMRSLTARELIWQDYHMAVACCEANHGKGTQEYTDCVNQADKTRDDALQHVREGRQDALNDNWEAAREHDRAWQETLQDMCPDFPDIRDITEPFIQNGLMNIEAVGMPGRSLYLREPIMAEEPDPQFHVDQYNFVGIASLDSPDLECTLDLDGSLIIRRDEVYGEDVFGVIKRGALVGTALDGTTITLTVIDNPGNTIEVDETGAGWMHVLTWMEHSDIEWDFALINYNRIRLPVTIEEDGSIAINTGWVLTDEYVPYAPWACSDYNRDGQLDFETDYAVYLADFDLQYVATDMNGDDIWNDDDIVIWTDRFQEDYDHMNN